MPDPGRSAPCAPAGRVDHEGVILRIETEAEAARVVRRTRRVLAASGAVVMAGLAFGVLVPMREIGHTWSRQDVAACQGSAFVEQAGAPGPTAARTALEDCLTHRRSKRWGPWGAFGNADDSSPYNAADD
jgi:hypothetical protein